MGSSTKLLRQYIRTVKQAKSRRKLWVFDFDDTLVKTDACTHVTDATGRKFDLTPGQFALYEKQPGDVFDYTDFERLINPRPIVWVNRILHNVYQHHGSESIVVLSARSYSEPIHQYLRIIELADIEVATLNTANPEAKANWIDLRIQRDNLEAVEFFDDSHKNVAVINALRHRHPDVEIIARHIIHNRVAHALSHP